MLSFCYLVRQREALSIFVQEFHSELLHNVARIGNVSKKLRTTYHFKDVTTIGLLGMLILRKYVVWMQLADDHGR